MGPSLQHMILWGLFQIQTITGGVSDSILEVMKKGMNNATDEGLLQDAIVGRSTDIEIRQTRIKRDYQLKALWPWANHVTQLLSQLLLLLLLPKSGYNFKVILTNHRTLKVFGRLRQEDREFISNIVRLQDSISKDRKKYIRAGIKTSRWLYMQTP